MALNTQVQQAREAGYSDTQIADYLGKKYQLPVEQARHAGYEDTHIVDYLSKKEINRPSPTADIDAAREANLPRAQGDLATGRPELDIQVPQPPVQAPADTSMMPTGREAMGALQGGTLKAAGGATTLLANELAPAAGGARITPEMRAQIMEHAQQTPNSGGITRSTPEQAQAYFDQLNSQGTPEQTAAYFANLEQQNAARRGLPGMRAAGKEMVAAGNDVLQETQPQNPGFVKRNILGIIKGAPALAIGTAAGIATRSPVAGAAVMGSAAGAESYADVLDNPTLSEGEKAHFAAATTGLSSVFNLLPMGKAMQPGVGAIRRFLASFAINVPAQEANMIAQHALNQKAGVDEQWTDEQWGAALLDSAVQAGAFSAVHTGSGSIVEASKARQQRQLDKMQSTRPDLENEIFNNKPPEEAAPQKAVAATEPTAAKPAEPTPAPTTPPKAKAKKSVKLAEPSEEAAPTPTTERTIDKRSLADAFTTDEDGTIDTGQADQAVRAQVKEALDQGMAVIQHSKSGVKKNSFLVDDPAKVDVQSVVNGKSRLRIVAADSPLIDQLTKPKGGENDGQDQDQTRQGQQASLLEEQPSLADKVKEASAQPIVIKPTEKGFTLVVDGKPTAGAYTTMEDAQAARSDLQKSMETGELNKKPELPAAEPKKEKTAGEIQRELMASKTAVKEPVAAEPEKVAQPSTEVAPIKDEHHNFQDFVDSVGKRFAMEDQGQAILDKMTETKESPKTVAQKFWSDTYPLLGDKGKRRFEKYVKNLGFQPGEVLSVDRGGKKEVAKDWQHIGHFLAEDHPESADDLEGIDRGYVSMMKWANEQADLFKTVKPTELDTAAHEAATSPQNALPDPTHAQIEANNYKLGHLKLHGLDISIENPKGSIRSSKPGADVPWKSTMQAHYGYIRGTVGKDKDHLDVFVGPHAEDEGTVFVFDQPQFNGKGFDEHKIMLGFDGLKEAKEAYAGSYNKEAQPMANAVKVSHFSMDEFKKWIAEGDHQQPASAFNPRVKTPIKTGEIEQKQESKITVSADKILLSKKGFDAANANNFRGKSSKTSGPLDVWKLDDGRLLLVDGYHRYAKMVKDGETKVSVKIVGNGYTDHATPLKGDTFSLKDENEVIEAPEKKKIEDFGEHLAGARKDYAAKLRDAESKDVATASLSESWPEPNYQKLLENGADPWAVGFMHAARDSIPPKPKKSWKLNGWVRNVNALRDVSFKLANGDINVEQAKQKILEHPALQPVVDQIDLYHAVGHDTNIKGITLREHAYGLYNGIQYSPPKRIWTVEKSTATSAMSNWPRTLASGDTKEEAIANFKSKVGELTSAGQSSKDIKFELYSTRGTNEYFIGKKIGKTVVKVKTGFTDLKTARKYLEDNHAELVSALAKMKEVPYERRTENAPRVGVDHRHGVDVTPEQFSEQFGFRGVQFGNYVENDRRQRDLNQAFDALMDLAAVIDVPPRALSLNGQLGLAFGARGIGGKRAPAAHYELGRAVINLTKGAGAGSLAHEWFHGLDNYFAGKAGDKVGMVTLMAKAPEGIRPEMFEAFKGILRAVKNSELMKRSLELDKTRSKPYWSTMHEMAARSFETYTINKLRDAGGSNDYLANVINQDAWEIVGGHDYPYPTVSETPAIRAAFDHFFNTIEHKENADKIELHDLDVSHRAAIKDAIRRASDDVWSRPELTVEDKFDVTDKLQHLKKMAEAGKLTPRELAERLTNLQRNALVKDKPPVQLTMRGANYVRDQLKRAQDLGYLDARGVAFAKWFIDKNPRLIDELSVMVRDPKESKPGINGTYYPLKKLMEIVTATAKPTTAVHEMLHHLEQLMPPKMRAVIRNEYWRQVQEQLDAAIKNNDINKVQFFDAIQKYNMTGDKDSANSVKNALLRGEVPGSYYQYYNPSEFWAVNSTYLLTQRYAARDSQWNQIKNWLKEFIEHVKNVFGKSSYAPLLKALKELIDGKGLKETSGEMLHKASSPKFNEMNVPPPKEPSTPKRDGRVPKEPTTFVSPEPSKKDTFLYDWQNKHIDMKRVVEAIEKVKGETLPDNVDPYLGEELYHQRTAYRVKRYLDDELRPLLEATKSAGVSAESLEKYLWMRHAPERNKTIEKRNPEMTDGSGVSTAEANKYMASLSPADKAKLEGLALKVDQMIDNTRKTLVGYGLESQSTVDLWKSAWPKYVPLHREDFENDSAYGIGQGFSVKGSSTKQAFGSTRPVANVLAQIAMQRERAITRGEKNRVALALYGLAKDNTNPNWWSTERLPMKRYIDKQTGLVVSQVDPSWKNKEKVVVARYPNSKGNIVEKGVVFNERNERAMRMAVALKNLDADQLEGVIGGLSKASRYVSAVNTQYDPLFGLWNLGRDLQEGLLNATSTPIRYEKKKIMRYSIQSMRGIWQDARAARRSEHPPSEWAKWFERMEKSGGTTGYRDLFKTAKDRADAIVDELNSMDANHAKRAFNATKGFLSDYNLVCESAVRVAAFRTAVEKGLSDARAASISKNLTINFNRKGRNGQQANALYSFFNARVQGAARMLETLAGPAGRKIIAGGLLLGAIQAVMLAAAGYDDNDPPEFIKENNFVIPIGNGKYVLWNMPQGGRPLVNMGRIPTEYAIRKTTKAANATANLFSSLMDFINPLGNSTVMQSASPTALDPIAGLSENKKFSGEKIYREKQDPFDPTPGFKRSMDSATAFSKVTARGINALSGGTDYVAGHFSPTPDQIDYLVNVATGGPGRLISNAEQTLSSTVTGDELPLYKVPLIGKIVGSTNSPESRRSRFYELVRDGRANLAEIKGELGEKDADTTAVRDKYLEKHPEFKQSVMAAKAEGDIAKLRAERRLAASHGANRDKLHEFDAKINSLMDQVLNVDNEHHEAVTE